MLLKNVKTNVWAEVSLLGNHGKMGIRNERKKIAEKSGFDQLNNVIFSRPLSVILSSMRWGRVLLRISIPIYRSNQRKLCRSASICGSRGLQRRSGYQVLDGLP